MQLSFFDWLKPIRESFQNPRLKVKNKKPRRRKKKDISDPALFSLWKNIRERYFPDRPDIDEYTVIWSTRPQKRTLASCCLELKRIRVARELNYQKYLPFLEPLLYHEMCHAILGLEVEKKNGKSRWHGKQFKKLENQHPMIKTLDDWIKVGGWNTAVKSDRMIRYHQSKSNKMN